MLDRDDVRRANRIEDVLPELTGHALIRRSGSREPVIKCPWHPDEHPSLRLNTEKQLWRCDPCDIGGDVFSFVERFQNTDFASAKRWLAARAGLNGNSMTIAATYDYRDESGALLYQVVRFQPKTFRQRRPDGSGGWINNMDGVRRVIYRLPDLKGKPSVFVTEGEKDADRLWSAGLPATTNAGGAGKWRDGYAQQLVAAGAKKVAIVPDNDDAGRVHAEEVARACHAAGLEVRVVHLPGVPEKGDVSDYLAHHTRDELVALAQATAPYATSANDTAALTTESAIRFYTARELAALGNEEIRWIVPPYVAEGLITELDGKIKHGKTTLVLQLVRSVLTSTDFLGQPTNYTPVVYLTEQSHQSFKPQLRKAGLLERDDLVILHRWDLPAGFTWPQTMRAAESKAVEIGAKLVVVDTLSQFAGLEGDEENNSGAAYVALEPLQRAAQGGLGLLLPRHERKGGGEVGDSARGSSAFGGAVDIILALQRPQGRAETVRVLHALGRTDPPPAVTLDYRREDGTYISLGSETAVRHQEAKSAVRERLPLSLENGLTEKEIIDLAVKQDHIKAGTARDALRELLASGEVHREKVGRQPYKYWRSGPANDVDVWDGPLPDDEAA